MVDKAIKSLINSINDMLKQGIESIFEWISLILYGVFDPGAKGDYDPAGLIQANPMEWNGGSVWGIVKSISDNAIAPIGTLILLVVLINELIQMLVSGNQFENVGVGVFVKWSIKAIIGIVLVSSVFDITTWCFGFGVVAGSVGLEKLGGSLSSNQIELNVGDLNTGQLLIILVLALLVFLAVCLLLITIMFTLAGRMIEIYMYLAIAPIPVATFMNSEWKSIGNSWFKGIFALAFQAVFIVIALAVFTGIFGGVITTMNSDVRTGGAGLIFRMLMLFAYTLALIMTIMRSGSISKSVFSAH